MRKVGCPKKLADLIRNGLDDPETLKALSTENLRVVCNAVEIPIPANTTKVYNYIFASLYLPYSCCIIFFMYTGTDGCSFGMPTFISAAR